MCERLFLHLLKFLTLYIRRRDVCRIWVETQVSASCKGERARRDHTLSYASLHRIPDGYDSLLARLRGSDAMLGGG